MCIYTYICQLIIPPELAHFLPASITFSVTELQIASFQFLHIYQIHNKPCLRSIKNFSQIPANCSVHFSPDIHFFTNKLYQLLSTFNRNILMYPLQ